MSKKRKPYGPHKGYTATPRGNNSYLVRVSTGKRNPETGSYEQIPKTIYAKNKGSLRSQAEAFRDHVKKGYSGDITKVTVKEYLREYFENTAPMEAKPETVEGYKQKMEAYVYPEIGDEQLSLLTARRMDALFAKLHKAGKIGQQRKDSTRGKGSGEPLSPRTIRQIRNILNKAFKKAVAHGIIQISPTYGTTIPTAQVPEKEILDRTHIKALLEWIDTSEDRAHAIALAIMLHTGMRRAEVLGLTWQDITFYDSSKGGSIRVWRTLKVKRGGGTFYDTPKSKAGTRSIPIATHLYHVLKKHQKQQSEYLNILGSKQTQETPIVLKVDGQVMKPDHITKKTSKLFKKMGFPKSTCNHTLRHNFVSCAASHNVPQTTAMQIVGHSSPILTASVYAHRTEGSHEAAVEIVGGVYDDTRKEE